VVADVNAENLRGACALVPAETVAPRDILFSDADVLAPCALGNVLNSQTIPHIRAKVVVGAANNQLATADDGARLTERGILYAPDYVVNAGGVISVAHEYLGKSTEERVRSEVCRIPERLRQIFAEAESSAQPTNVVADELARRIVAHGAPGLAINQTTAGRLIA
ncbi:MAG: amino acid dehydrogenase, partial [Gammaproteobacteria bacterium]|nr:amino acid dehydrogenase [Gammaproteobacteria bacterium]